MTKRIAGRFYFKRTVNGNLIGEWSNNDPKHSRIFSESCDVIGEPTRSFVGKYQSTWQEDGAAVIAELNIAKKSTGLFDIEWDCIASPHVKFKGEGMLCDEVLMGDYHKT